MNRPTDFESTAANSANDYEILAHMSYRYLIGSLVTVFTLLGLVGNLILLYVLHQNWKPLNQCFNVRPILSLLISSLLFYFGNFSVGTTCSFFDCAYSDSVLIGLSSTNTVAYFTYQLGLVYVAAERVLVFWTKKRPENLALTSIICLIIVWVIGIAITVVPIPFQCVKTWYRPGYKFIFDCSMPWIDFYSYLGQGCALLMIFMYAGIFLKIRILRMNSNSRSQTKSDIALALQFLTISILAWASTFLFMVFSGDWLWLGLVSSLTSTVSMSSNAFILLAYNKAIQSSTMQSLKLRKKSLVTNVTPLNTIRSRTNSAY